MYVYVANFFDPASSQHHNSGGGGGGGGGVHGKKKRKKKNFTLSQLSALSTHTRSLGRVGQGALELGLPQIRKCHFLSDCCVFGYIF